jgi:dTMP kinase
MAASGEVARRGRFITIDGPDGGGKTTQAELLAAHLERAGTRVVRTREPGGTRLGERLRDVLLAPTADEPARDPMTDAILFNAARRQLVTEVIRPALEAGATVICARFGDSTLAYQGYGAGVDLATLRTLADVATDGLVPDRTFLLDLPVEAGLARKAPGDITRFEAEFDLDFHRRVRAGFLALAAAEPTRFHIVDATAGIDTVAREIAAVVDADAVSAHTSAGIQSEPRTLGERSTG